MEGHFISASHLATWASDQVRMYSAKEEPGGESNTVVAMALIGVTGNVVFCARGEYKCMNEREEVAVGWSVALTMGGEGEGEAVGACSAICAVEAIEDGTRRRRERRGCESVAVRVSSEWGRCLVRGTRAESAASATTASACGSLTASAKVAVQCDKSSVELCLQNEAVC